MHLIESVVFFSVCYYVFCCLTIYTINNIKLLKVLVEINHKCKVYNMRNEIWSSHFIAKSIFLPEIWLLEEVLGNQKKKVKHFYFCTWNFVSVSGNQSYSFWFSDNVPHFSNSKTSKIFENLNPPFSLYINIMPWRSVIYNLTALYVMMFYSD